MGEAKMKQVPEVSPKDEAIAKGVELSKSLDIPIHTMVFFGQDKDGNYDENDLVVGYIREPSFLVKARAMDKSLLGMGFSAAIEILDACLVKEHSDPRILCELPGKDKYRLGAAEFCRNKILIARDQSEKKN